MKFFFLSLILVVACQKPIQPSLREIASHKELPPVEQGEVWGPKNEQQASLILNQLKTMIEKKAAGNGKMERDAHPKAHGCVKAFLDVDASKLPADLQVGIWAKKSTRPAWVRFSNGDPGGEGKHDLEVDVRGMAVKIMNVPGTPKGSQDLVMMNAKEFFSENGDDYLALFHALDSGSKFDLVKYGITHPKSVKRLLAARVKISNPLETSFHSSVIYKLGKTSMRFKAEPCAVVRTSIPKDKDSTYPHYLRQRLISSMEKAETCFSISVQPNTNPKKQPVEDPREEWSSPFYRVATLRLPQQKGIGDGPQMNMCENLSFDPWNTLPATRPMGQINRARAIVYEEIARYRHARNGRSLIEPTSHNVCVGPESDLCQDPHLISTGR